MKTITRIHDFQPGDTLVLKAKTHYGRNKIQQHGDTWIVQSTTIPPGRLTIRSSGKTFRHLDGSRDHDLRWINWPDDKDFEIISCTGVSDAESNSES